MVPRRVDVVALGLAVAKVALQLVAIRPYGYFRDELYYLACSERLAWGYVDHPPLSIALLRGWRAVFGDSLVAIRLVPALAGAMVVYLVARTARLLGATARPAASGTVAAAIAGSAALFIPAALAIDHLYSMNAIEHLAWAVVTWIMVRIALTPDDRRLWIGLGVALGLGGLDKWSLAWLAPGVALGLGVSSPGARRMLRTPWPWVAIVIAGSLVAPHVAWELEHRWPTLEFMRNALEKKYVSRSFGAFVAECAVIVGPVMLVVLAGVAAPLARWRRSDVTEQGRRALALAFVVAFVILASSRSTKAEYVLSLLPLALAPGGAWLGERLRDPGRAMRVAVAVVGVATVGYVAVLFPLALPVLSEEGFVAYARRVGIHTSSTEKKTLAALPQHYADMHGWPELADEAAQAWSTLSDDEKTRAKIWARTGGYGPAAAIDFFGPARGLPHAISGHNEYWLRGYGRASDDVAVVLGGSREALLETFESVTLVATFPCQWCMPYETDKPIYVARGMKQSWAELWPRERHYE